MALAARMVATAAAFALSVSCGGSSCPQAAAPVARPAPAPAPAPVRSEMVRPSVPDERAQDDLAGVDLATVEPRPLLRQWLLDLRQHEASLAVSYGPAHPVMQALRAEIEALEWADAQWDAWGGGVLALRFASLCRREARLSISYGDKHPARAEVSAEKSVVSDEIETAVPGSHPSCAPAQ